MSFISEMTKALAWPIALVVGLIFKRTINSLLEGVRLRRIGKGEWSADFETAAQEVRAELPGHTAHESAPVESGRIGEEIERLVDIAPAIAISEVWTRLEEHVRTIATRAGIRQHLLPEVLRGLAEKGMIRPATVDAILGLRNMRNLAVHASGERLTRAQAIEFITMADAIT